MNANIQPWQAAQLSICTFSFTAEFAELITHVTDTNKTIDIASIETIFLSRTENLRNIQFVAISSGVIVNAITLLSSTVISIKKYRPSSYINHVNIS